MECGTWRHRDRAGSLWLVHWRQAASMLPPNRNFGRGHLQASTILSRCRNKWSTVKEFAVSGMISGMADGTLAKLNYLINTELQVVLSAPQRIRVCWLRWLTDEHDCLLIVLWALRPVVVVGEECDLINYTRSFVPPSSASSRRKGMGVGKSSQFSSLSPEKQKDEDIFNKLNEILSVQL